MDAYEIRLELLKLAQSIEGDRIWGERQRLEMDWNTKKERTEAMNGVVGSHIKYTVEEFPELPVATYQDIIKVAEELNKFVSNKG